MVVYMCIYVLCFLYRCRYIYIYIHLFLAWYVLQHHALCLGLLLGGACMGGVVLGPMNKVDF